MKKFLILCIIVILSTLTAAPALAADPVEIPELDMTFVAPEGWIVVTREVKADNPFLQLTEQTPEKMIALMDEADVYAYLFSDDFTRVMLLVAVSSEDLGTYTLKDATDKDIAEFLDTVKSNDGSGFSFLKTDDDASSDDTSKHISNEVLSHPDIPFIYLHETYEDEDGKSEILYATTANNGLLILWGLKPFEARKMNDDDHRILKAFIDDVHFTRMLDDPHPDDDEMPVGVIGGAVAAIVGGIAVGQNKKKKKKAAEEAARQAAAQQQMDNPYNNDNQTPLM